MVSGAGVRIVPEPHGQRPATARNSVDFPRPVSPTISTRSPGVTTTVASSMMMCPSGRRMRTPSKARCPSGCSARLISSAPSSIAGRSSSASRKRATRWTAARQSASREKLSTNHRIAPCTWLKAPATMIRPPRVKAAAEIGRRGHENRNDERQPAGARRDPGEVGEGGGYSPHGVDDSRERGFEMAVFVLLPAMQRDALAGFVDPNEGEAEFRLARISLAIQGNQRPPHEPSQTGADQGIGEGTPDHVTRNGDVVARRPGT